MIRHLTRTLSAALLLLTVPVLVGCMSPDGETVEDRREYVRNMRDAAIDQSIEDWPELSGELGGAVGYMVFESLNTKILLAGTASGYGLLVDNATGEESFLCHTSITLGPGFEIGTIRSVFVITDREVFEYFKTEDWEFGAAANAGFVIGDFGGAVTGVTIGDGIKEYRTFTQGVSLFASLFWAKLGFDDRLYEMGESPGN